MAELFSFDQNDLEDNSSLSEGYGLSNINQFVDDAEQEAIAYWEANRSDPRAGNWEWDAFVHSYVSGRLVQEYSEATATVAGYWQEMRTRSNSSNQANQDFWSNRVGRDTAEVATSKEDLADRLMAKIGDVDANGTLDEDELMESPFQEDVGEEYDVPTYEADNIYYPATKLVAEALADYYSDQKFFNPDQDVDSEGADTQNQSTKADYIYKQSGTDTVEGKIGDGVANGSPLILDLDDSGTIDLIAFSDTNTTFFDIDEDGFAEQAGWVAAEDGLLAIDLNQDGYINDNGELFGSMSEDGFSSLSEYDSNSDGHITSQDAVWSDLIIWQDANENAFSESVEQHVLDDFDIVSIDLDATEVSQNNSGHSVSHTSTFVVDDGVNPADTRIIHDVWFNFDQVNSYYIEPYTSPLSAAVLPNVRGYGELADLLIAMSLDSSGAGNLHDLVLDLAFNDMLDVFTSDSTAMDAVEDIMYRWAGADGVAVDSRGTNIDARKLEFLEKMIGQDFLQRGFYSNPGPLAAEDLDEAFFIAHQSIYARIVSQSSGAELFTYDSDHLMGAGLVAENMSAYDLITDSFSGITGLDGTVLATLETEAAGFSTTTEKETFWKNVVRMVEYSIGTSNLPGADQDALDDAITDSDASLDLQGILDSLDAYAFAGGADNDVINGTSGDDTIDGGLGNDYLKGSSGNDDYEYFLGDGYDTIREGDSGAGQFDEIIFGAGIAIGDLTMTRVGNTDLVIDIDTGSQTGQIIIENQFNYAAGGGHVEQITFDDLSTYDLDGQNWTTYGTSGDDSISGVASGGLQDDTIYGGAGDDYLYGGYSGDDTLYGEDGNDEILGSYGADVIYGGAGDDDLDGGAGDDEIHAGTGNDTIYGGGGADDLYYTSGHLTITGGQTSDTIYLDAAWDTVTPDYFEIGSDLQIVFDLDNTITIDGMFSTTAIHDMIYDDTTTVDLSGVTYFTQGTSGDDTLSGSGGDDVLYGFGGNDEINGGGSYGYGNDTMYGGTGDDELNGGYDNDYLDGGAGDDDITGGAGDDTIFYVSGHDLVYDYTGTDVLEIDGSWEFGDLTIGRHISDLYDLRIDFGSGAVNSVTITNMFWSGYQVDTLRLNDGTGDINLLAIDYTTYGDAGANNLDGLTNGNVNGGDTNDTIYGYGGSDDIDGYDGDDTMYGGDGDDNLNGGYGEDYLVGGAGDDVLWGERDDDHYFYESGDDIVQDRFASTDMLELDSSWAYGDVTIGRYTTDLSDYVITFAGTATDSVTIQNMFYGSYQVETLRLNDGTGDINLMTMPITSYGTAGADSIDGVTNSNFESGDPVDIIYGYDGADDLDGNDGDDILYGGDGNDTLEGGYGDDLLYGGAGDDDVYDYDGNDTFVYEGGIDTYYNTYGNNDVDTVWITNGVVVDDIASIADYGSYETKITLTASVDEIILDSHQYSYSYWFNVLKFDDGFETDQLPEYSSWMWGSTGNDVSAGNGNDNVIIGDDGNDDIDAGAGADDVHGGSGTDDIHGDGGDDFLHGGGGDDTLYGDGGLDTLWGGDGSDTFTFDSTNAYTETDVIADFDSANDAIDISDLLTAYDPMTDALSDFVEITDNGTDSTLSVDADGGADSFAAVASILGVTGLTDEAALETSGALITS